MQSVLLIIYTFRFLKLSFLFSTWVTKVSSIVSPYSLDMRSNKIIIEKNSDSYIKKISSYFVHQILLSRHFIDIMKPTTCKKQQNTIILFQTAQSLETMKPPWIYFCFYHWDKLLCEISIIISAEMVVFLMELSDLFLVHIKTSDNWFLMPSYILISFPLAMPRAK